MMFAAKLRRSKGVAFLLFATLISTALGSGSAQACDESCKRAEAEKRLNTSFPKYLTKRYCRDVRSQFLTTASRSLTRYRDTKLPDLHRGGMFNTRKFLLQRREWLGECDQYLSNVSRYHIFRSAKTTKDIFSAIDGVTKILEALVNGATYVSDGGYDSVTAAKERFDRLLSLMDSHKTQLQLAGQLNKD